MKRSIALFFLCVALGLAAVIGGAEHIYRTRDQVEVTETTLVGDPAWAEGLTMSGEYTWGDTLYWNLSYSLGDLDQAESTFELCPEGKHSTGDASN